MLKKMKAISEEDQRAIALGQLHQLMARLVKGRVAEMCVMWHEKARHAMAAQKLAHAQDALDALQAEMKAVVASMSAAHEQAMHDAEAKRSVEQVTELQTVT